MKAVALVRRRVVVANDAFAEVVVWRVAQPVPPSRHQFKYRLAYVVAGQCVVLYDNERGKGAIIGISVPSGGRMAFRHQIN